MNQSGIVAGTMGLLGVLVGSLISFLALRSNQKRQNAFELSRDFQNALQLRSTAGKVFGSNIGKSLTAIESAVREDKVSKDDWDQASYVLHFFDNLAFMLNHKLLDKKHAQALFTRYFTYFYAIYFEEAFKAESKEEDSAWYELIRNVTDLKYYKIYDHNLAQRFLSRRASLSHISD